MLTDSVLCCIWPFGLFLWRSQPFSRPVVALKGERRLVEAVIWKKWCHKRWFEVTEQNGTLPRALEPTRVLCPSYIIVKKNYPTTWLLRRIIRRNLATDSRGTSQLGVKQQKWWKNSTKNKWKEEAYNTGYSQAVTCIVIFWPSWKPVGWAFEPTPPFSPCPLQFWLWLLGWGNRWLWSYFPRSPGYPC